MDTINSLRTPPRLSLPAFKATAPAADPLAVSDTRETSAARAAETQASSSPKWGHKAMVAGLMGAAALLGPLGTSMAQAAPAPTVQIQQHDESAASVEAHFTNANFQRGSAPRGNFGGSHQTFGGSRQTFGAGRQTFSGGQSFGRTQNFGNANRGNFNRGNQGSFNWNRGGAGQQFHQQAPARQNFPSARQNFGGQGYNAPRGGFVSRAQMDHPDMRSTVIERNVYRNSYVNVNQWNRGHWGNDWFSHPYGFYAGNAFWAGYLMGEDWAMMTNPYYFMQQPVYVVSPMTGTICGQMEAPGGGAYSSETAAQVGALSLMANPQQTDGQYDASAGLYRADSNGQATSERIEAPYAYNLLNHGQTVVFHPPNGDYEQLSSLNDLAPYIVTSSPAAQ